MNQSPQWQMRQGEPDHPLAPTAHPNVLRVLHKLPPAILATFTPAQLEAIADAMVPPKANHKIDYRVSLPFFGRRHYLAILFGRERRNLKRLQAEQLASPSKTVLAYLVAGAAVLSWISVSSVILLYTIKSAFGISLRDGHSFLHDLVYLQML